MGKIVLEALRVVAADLHIHTCLSPCASLDMTPLTIARKAREKNLGIIGITDHNSAENAAAVMAAGRELGICVIPGMEVTTAEEVHIVGLFDDLAGALSMQSLVYEKLQSGENDEDLFGMQVVANALDEVESINKRLLIGATTLGLNEVVAAIHAYEGLVLAAHIDRPSYSMVGQLGFIPEGLDLDAVEISKQMTLSEARARYREYERFSFITGSDAHSPEEIGAHPTCIQIGRSGMAELRKALAGREGRKVLEEAGCRAF
ncbi:MAG: PHP domain-containing protein [Deltaproteobacteria bacterium]|nr:PHP domain-containing protein [Deltaproteobacteria bacterium]